MGRWFVLTLCVLLVDGVFGVEVMAVSLMEGDSVTLNTGVTKQQHDKMLWYFEDTLIALINDPDTSCLYDGEDGRFRGRVKVDYETGSLTITNITSEHTGRYEAEIIRRESPGTSQSFNRNPKCDSTKITRKIRTTRDDTIKTFSLIVSGGSVNDIYQCYDTLNVIDKCYDSFTSMYRCYELFTEIYQCYESHKSLNGIYKCYRAHKSLYNIYECYESLNVIYQCYGSLNDIYQCNKSPK
ncbi:uncharacterized protein LOC130086913 [Rhinichthys klamathensis goyatoka]|uniref:uncharacterized protein LOC130086913 n=1 Tax=Rhinichthys klamathensis goyatoka TaxID=3034132 RepID=UPI0024B4932C|nr:uncharacterized protein LOC130086913 [Rhinichthys klamathensis goyatoka]